MGLVSCEGMGYRYTAREQLRTYGGNMHRILHLAHGEQFPAALRHGQVGLSRAVGKISVQVPLRENVLGGFFVDRRPQNTPGASDGEPTEDLRVNDTFSLCFRQAVVIDTGPGRRTTSASTNWILRSVDAAEFPPSRCSL